ncbi:hypothetical protein [Brevundimonas vesicularis]|uniref:hypothetical protein n=1 Tax=Brevundimonas vesicularis TaxID=41276 RepID=UPI0022ABDFF1|nr:hypothetical protein [Brevundimonas vesicularis]
MRHSIFLGRPSIDPTRIRTLLPRRTSHIGASIRRAVTTMSSTASEGASCATAGAVVSAIAASKSNREEERLIITSL